MSTTITDRKNPLEHINPELGGKVVKLIADDMARARRASEEKAEKAKKAKKKRKAG